MPNNYLHRLFVPVDTLAIVEKLVLLQSFSCTWHFHSFLNIFLSSGIKECNGFFFSVLLISYNTCAAHALVYTHTVVLIFPICVPSFVKRNHVPVIHFFSHWFIDIYCILIILILFWLYLLWITSWLIFLWSLYYDFYDTFWYAGVLNLNVDKICLQIIFLDYL